MQIIHFKSNYMKSVQQSKWMFKLANQSNYRPIPVVTLPPLTLSAMPLWGSDRLQAKQHHCLVRHKFV